MSVSSILDIPLFYYFIFFFLLSFAKDRDAINLATHIFRHTMGNFYINDKSTGAIVGQQAFGGSRSSGTNDKAGSPLNLLRWVSPRTIKETFLPISNVLYPSNQ